MAQPDNYLFRLGYALARMRDDELTPGNLVDFQAARLRRRGIAIAEGVTKPQTADDFEMPVSRVTRHPFIIKSDVDAS